MGSKSRQGWSSRFTSAPSAISESFAADVVAEFPQSALFFPAGAVALGALLRTQSKCDYLRVVIFFEVVPLKGGWEVCGP